MEKMKTLQKTIKKVGVIKLGSRISYGGKDTSGGNGEVRSIISILKEAGIEVHVFTKILEKDILLPGIYWYNIVDNYQHINNLGLDALLVLNGNVNFFGGAEDRSQILNYYLINNFTGRVFYILCDPALPLKQIWPSVAKKPWARSYEQSSVHISRKDIVYISQPFRTDLLLDMLPKNNIDIFKVWYYPFEKFPCLKSPLAAVNPTELKADISYGGTMRGGKREKKMIDFYFGYDSSIDVEMFGKIELKNFNPKKYGDLRPPRFSGTVPYDEFHDKMNTVLSTVVIGDPLYEQLEDINQRVYESIWSNVITFIDDSFDSRHRVFGADEELSDFLYVKNRKYVEERIKILKKEPSVRDYILQKQFEAVDFDPHKYSQSLIHIMESNL